MKIIKRKGEQGNNDYKYFIKQQEGRLDGINMVENCILANQLIINELRKEGGKEKIDKYGNFLFSNAISDAVIMGCLGIDLWKNEFILKQFCRRHFLKLTNSTEMEDEDESS
jgi:hypothetical protein